MKLNANPAFGYGALAEVFVRGTEPKDGRARETVGSLLFLANQWSTDEFKNAFPLGEVLLTIVENSKYEEYATTSADGSEHAITWLASIVRQTLTDYKFTSADFEMPFSWIDNNIFERPRGCRALYTLRHEEDPHHQLVAGDKYDKAISLFDRIIETSRGL